MTCAIAATSTMCEDCGRLVMPHSICPVSGIPNTPPDPATVGDMLNALLNGRTRAGQPVKVNESVTLQKFDGDTADGQPIETIRILNGAVVERIIHKEE